MAVAALQPGPALTPQERALLQSVANENQQFHRDLTEHVRSNRRTLEDYRKEYRQEKDNHDCLCMMAVALVIVAIVCCIGFFSYYGGGVLITICFTWLWKRIFPAAAAG
jgi:hypothetical protein